MKNTFTPEYILGNHGCYSKEETKALSFMNNKTITIEDIANVIPLKDLRWFIFNKCELTLIEKRQLANNLARTVLPIYTNKYPNDKRIENCINATDSFIKGNITKEELYKFRITADAADAAAYAAAADAAAYAAAAAADAAASDAAAYAAAAAAAADAAANDNSTISYKDLIKQELIRFVNNNN